MQELLTFLTKKLDPFLQFLLCNSTVYKISDEFRILAPFLPVGAPIPTFGESIKEAGTSIPFLFLNRDQCNHSTDDMTDDSVPCFVVRISSV